MCGYSIVTKLAIKFNMHNRHKNKTIKIEVKNVKNVKKHKIVIFKP